MRRSRRRRMRRRGGGRRDHIVNNSIYRDAFTSLFPRASPFRIRSPAALIWEINPPKQLQTEGSGKIHIKQLFLVILTFSP